MLRYKNVPSIEFNLENGYMVKADYVYNRETEKYEVSLHIRDIQVDQWNLMGQYDKVEFEAGEGAQKTIKSRIAKYVTELFYKGEFGYYVDRTDMELKCFDYGLEHLNGERGVK